MPVTNINNKPIYIFVVVNAKTKHVDITLPKQQNKDGVVTGIKVAHIRMVTI